MIRIAFGKAIANLRFVGRQHAVPCGTEPTPHFGVCSDRAFEEGVDPVAIDSYFLVDYISSIKIGRGQLQIGIENLLDNQYFPVFSQALLRPIDRFAGRGRTVSVRYQINW